MNKEEFIEKHCKECGSQRCEGIGTAWFDGCPFRGELTSVKELEMYNKIEIDKLALGDIDAIDRLKKDLTW